MLKKNRRLQNPEPQNFYQLRDCLNWFCGSGLKFSVGYHAKVCFFLFFKHFLLKLSFYLNSQNASKIKKKLIYVP
jgi:hypothetical protein